MNAADLPSTVPGIDELRARGVDRFDPSEVRYLARIAPFVDERTIARRTEALVASFEAAREAAEAILARDDFDDETREEMRARFAEHDFFGVELLAATGRKRPHPLREAWLLRIQKRAESLGVGLGGEGARALRDVIAASAIDARAAAIAEEARALDLETVGPYNSYAVALRVLGRLDEIAPTYLASWVAWLEDVASLVEPAKDPRKRR